MIIWLASYPKSGNTWIRAFISTLLFSKDGINDFSNLSKIRQFPNRDLFKNFVKNFQDPKEIYTNWKNAQDLINLDNKIKFFKTHHVNCEVENFKFTDNDNSLGVIHIVRDPRTVLVSLKKHFKLNDFQKAKNIILNENSCVGFVKKDSNNKSLLNKVPTLIGSWGLNYLSWKNKIQNYLLIKYEDLVSNPNEEFYKISNYLEKLINCKFDKYKIDNAIKTTSFDNLQKLEKNGLFKEYEQNMNFFHLGPKNNWKTQLDTKIVDEINIKFKNEMLELGYLK
tara:strand:+ start:78 stop:920 length:843 start_codon:yes stop_codon:yes gene_type:complete